MFSEHFCISRLGQNSKAKFNYEEKFKTSISASTFMNSVTFHNFSECICSLNLFLQCYLNNSSDYFCWFCASVKYSLLSLPKISCSLEGCMVHSYT